MTKVLQVTSIDNKYLIFNMRAILLLSLVLATPGLVLGQERIEMPISAEEMTGKSAADNYIVILKEGITSAAGLPISDKSKTKSFRIGNFHALAGKFDAESLSALKSNTMVQYIEKDKIVKTLATVTRAISSTNATDTNDLQENMSAKDIQRGAPWGLARISQRQKLPRFSLFGRRYDYDPNGGEGIKVYVMDTGININHEDFEGRASHGATVFEDTADTHGHGTHVAGTVAGKRFGVSKRANVVNVKVLGGDGEGSTMGFIAGLEWIARNADKTKSVINMSLGFNERSLAVDMAVGEAIKNGLIVVAAAGNEKRDACLSSPAKVTDVISVAASNIDDNRWDDPRAGSNFGPACVTLWAPGEDIESADFRSNTGSTTKSGTSMAAPHVAGAVANLLSREGASSPQEMAEKLTQRATRNAISNTRGAPNLLLFEKNTD
ncbi:uncharacterized protein VTP21DRAFT_4800 [Calcarisporiella thermophila]|uniref:uncharacterized protein n=1 Tax=Calcarisporiella thermophila TaxID=911321 RepID=UPI0037448819